MLPEMGILFQKLSLSGRDGVARKGTQNQVFLFSEHSPHIQNLSGGSSWGKSEKGTFVKKYLLEI